MTQLKLPPVASPTELAVPPWVRVALEEWDEAEVRGAENDRIVEYHAATTLHATEDEVPWCSAFLCWTMERCGIESPRSARARDWSQWGRQTAPRFGAVAVLTREGGGHVGVLVASRGGRIRLLGGNQGDRVTIAAFDPARVLTYRWPVGIP